MTRLRKCSALVIPDEGVGWYCKCLKHILASHDAYKWDSRLWAPHNKHESALINRLDIKLSK